MTTKEKASEQPSEEEGLGKMGGVVPGGQLPDVVSHPCEINNPYLDAADRVLEFAVVKRGDLVLSLGVPNQNYMFTEQVLRRGGRLWVASLESEEVLALKASLKRKFRDDSGYTIEDRDFNGLGIKDAARMVLLPNVLDDPTAINRGMMVASAFKYLMDGGLLGVITLSPGEGEHIKDKVLKTNIPGSIDFLKTMRISPRDNDDNIDLFRARKY
jgi:hypothetical protein